MEHIQKLKAQYIQVRKNFMQSEELRSNAFDAISNFTSEIDNILIELFNYYKSSFSSDVALVALGGYGRLEMCPFSDVDLLVIHNQAQDSLSPFICALWDIGMPLGCVVRTIPECQKILGEDISTDTAYLDARFITGERNLFRKLESRVIKPYFSKRKSWFIQEMTSILRHNIFSPESALYVIEPDLKNGMCTLRDCQRVIWAYKVAHGYLTHKDPLEHSPFRHHDAKKFFELYETLLAIRSLIHIVNERRIDILEISAQDDVGENFGLGKNSSVQLMEHFFKTIKGIKEFILIFLVERKWGRKSILSYIRFLTAATPIQKDIKLLDGILYRSGQVPPANIQPQIWILDIFLLALQTKASLGIELRRIITNTVRSTPKENFFDPEVTQRVRVLFSSPMKIGPVLNEMHETELLMALFPELSHLVCKVEYDSFHEFTVDQHILLTVSSLDDLDQDPDPEIVDIFQKSSNQWFVLRLALFLHDMGKALPGEHAYTGSIIAENVCDRLGCSDNEKQSISLLVKYHLELSKLAFQRDPDDKILHDFAKKLGSLEIVNLLYLLTIIDIRCVGQKTWTAWKGVELQTVYTRLANFALQPDILTDQKDPVILVPDTDVLAKVIDPSNLEIVCESFGEFDRLSIYGIDRTHFFSDLVGCLSSEGYNILSAQISTTVNSIAYDVFAVEPDGSTAIPSSERIENIRRKWRTIIGGSANAKELLQQRYLRYPPKPQRKLSHLETKVKIDNDISKFHTLVEIRIADQFGLLYKIAQIFNECDINIVSAKLSTRATRAVDVFYVTDKQGLKLNDMQLQDKVKVLLGGL